MNLACCIAHIVSANMYLLLGAVILIQNHKRPLNRVCSALLFCFFIWSASYAGIHFPGIDRSRAMMFENIASIGWISFSFFFLWFAWLYAQRLGFKGDTVVAGLLALIPCILIYLQWNDRILIDIHVLQDCGWTGLWSEATSPWVYYGFYLATVSAALYLIYDHGQRNSKTMIQRQSRVLLVSALVSLCLGSLTNVILRRAGNTSVPSLADCTTAIWAFGLAWAVIKYNLLSITPGIAADRIIESMKDFLFLLDPHGRIISSNPAARESLGFTDADLAGKAFSMFLQVDPGERERFAGLIKTTGLRECEITLLTRQGIKMPVSLSTSAIKNIGIVCVAHDVTLQKERTELLHREKDKLEMAVSHTTEKLEKVSDAMISERKKRDEETLNLKQELHHAQKMEAIGRLAGGIAHDFNNLLGGIVGYADLLRMKCASTLPSEASTAQKIVDIARQASTLTSQLLAFARKGKYQVVPVDLQECINDTVLILERTIGKKITIIRRFTTPHSVVMGDRSQLQNAMLNLGVNARDAMAGGGTLTFETSTMEMSEDLASSYPYTVKPGTFITLSVIDSGEGMDEETRAKAFEPFFTTKTAGKGTGLGLASVYGTIKNHNGFIELRSKKGKGTSVIICLPLATAEPLRQQEQTAAKRETKKGCILFVDDERFVREMAVDALKMLGYPVTPCSSGAEALELFQKNVNEYSLVIVDFSMPGMSGNECFHRLKEINASVKVIVTSGHVLDNEISTLLNEGVHAFLQKPFEIRKLSELVSKALMSI